LRFFFGRDQSAERTPVGVEILARNAANIFARHFANFIMNAQGVRRDGAAALDLAYVACGRFDGFWEEGLKPSLQMRGAIRREESSSAIHTYFMFSGYSGSRAFNERT